MKMRLKFGHSILATALLAGLSACVVNPVTGEREFAMVSEAQRRSGIVCIR
jgi:hypothetical protein